MNFSQAVDIVLRLEGGYVFDSNDPGGETNFGISKRFRPDLDIKNLTREKATEIYKNEYWDKLHLDALPSPIRLCLFDCAINQGLDRAIKILQGAVGVKKDGVIGEQTLRATEALKSGDVASDIIRLRLGHYTSLPHFGTYGAGWCKRLLEIAMEVLRD